VITSFRTTLISVSWWLIWSTLHVATLMIYGLDLPTAVVESLVSNVILAGICAGVVYAVRFSMPSTGRVLSFMISAVLASFIWVWATGQILSELYVDRSNYLDFLSDTMAIRTIIGILMITLFMLFGWVVHVARENLDEARRLHEISKISKETELLNLRQQLQPHFLFNTLNSVSALAGSDPALAKKMIHQLSDFLRGTIRQSDERKNTLEVEIEHLKLYLEIEKVRFGNRLQTSIHVAPETLQIKLPSLLLQPLVENAIKFGLYDTLDEVLISIYSSVENDHLVIKITNPFDHLARKQVPGTGFGISSVTRRLYLLYGRNDLLATHVHENNFTVTIKIPLAS
jgi:two-component system LytT family sensor kinase